MFAKTIAVGEAYLFDQFFDVLVQHIQLSLHGKNHGNQFLAAAVIQFSKCMFMIHCPAPFHCIHYNRNNGKWRISKNDVFVIMPMCQKAV